MSALDLMAILGGLIAIAGAIVGAVRFVISGDNKVREDMTKKFDSYVEHHKFDAAWEHLKAQIDDVKEDVKDNKTAIQVGLKENRVAMDTAVKSVMERLDMIIISMPKRKQDIETD